jgi:phenol/toluene 2-monooxygenase (NADH) P4/A4
MAMSAAYGNYDGPVADTVDKFHGNQLVYVAWDQHLMFPCAAALPLPPAMPFGALVKEVLPTLYTAHPDFGKIKWEAVSWLLDGKAFNPKADASLADNGIGHKSLVRFATPGLSGANGIAGF